MSVTNNNMTDYAPTGTIFQSKLTNLLASSTSPKVIELRDKYRDALYATPSNTAKYYFAERDAYLDAKKALETPSPAEPAAPTKKPSLSPGSFFPVKKGDIPPHGNGAERKVTPINSNTSGKSTSGSSTPATSGTTSPYNWWSKIFHKKSPPKEKGKS